MMAMNEKPKRHVYIWAEATSGKTADLEAMMEQIGVKPARFIIGDEWSELPDDFSEKLDSALKGIDRELIESKVVWKSWGPKDG